MTAVDLIAQTLGAHEIESHGMTFGSPDRCRCGAETLPERTHFDDSRDARVLRDEAFAAHQAQAVTEALGLVEEWGVAYELDYGPAVVDAWGCEDDARSVVAVSPTDTGLRVRLVTPWKETDR